MRLLTQASGIAGIKASTVTDLYSDVVVSAAEAYELSPSQAAHAGD
jgi:hypothetical protein